MTPTQRTIALSITAALLTAAPVIAQAPPGGPPQPEFPPASEVLKEHEAQRGFLTLHVHRKRHRILGEIPQQLLGRKFFLATSIAGGPMTGWQWDDRTVYLERHDRRLVLVEPENRYRAGGTTLADVVKRTYRDRVLAALPILAEGPAGSLIIDLTHLFGERSQIFVGGLSSGIDPSLTKIAKVKAFPKNVEIELDFASVSRGGASMFGLGGGGSGLSVHYSLSEIPQTGYKPRPADDRVGYFVTALKDFSKPSRESSLFVRYINRWHLEKADPSLALSPPKDPIIFYVEKTVPIRFRRYVHEGILEWNKAFEKVGIIGAIVARQQTDSEFNDLDPEDVRYNFFRWITSEGAFAMGPSRVHPETGEILDADIIFDDAMLRSYLAEYDFLIEKGPGRALHPALQRYLAEHPERHPMRRWLPRRQVAVAGLAPAASEHPGEAGPAGPDAQDLIAAQGERDSPAAARRHRAQCELGDGVRHQVSFGLAALNAAAGLAAPPGTDPAQKPEWPEEFVGQVLKETVMHEVGHTLGLRHNFKASSWLSLDEINKSAGPPDAVTASVMDYNPINISPSGVPQGYWTTRTIGPYDYWAIEYGYKLTDDPKELAKVASRAAEKGLDYATDEDTWASDPLVNRFDLGADPLDYVARRMKLTEEMLNDLVARVVKPGEGFQRARDTFQMLLFDYSRSASFAARFIGGHNLHRDHRGDPGARPPVVPIAADKQRSALNLICERVFSDKAFRFPAELLNHLAVGRWSHWGSRDDYQDPELAVHDTVLRIQSWALFDVLNPLSLSLIADAELRVAGDADAITIPEVFGKLTDSIWAELKDQVNGKRFTNRAPFVSSLRRNLQQEYLGQLIDLALEDDSGRFPAAARAQASLQLEGLLGRIKTARGEPGSPPAFDAYSQAHLDETARRIGKALDAMYSRNGAASSSGGGIIIIGRPAEGEDGSR